MKIKTVAIPIEERDRFDKVVNALIAVGWILSQRKVIGTAGEPNEVGSCSVVQTLYAELYKEQ